MLYIQDSLDGEARVFLDPNTLSEDGTIALSGSRFTEDGSTFAYALSASGSDWNTIHLKDVETGKHCCLSPFLQQATEPDFIINLISF